MQAAIKDPFQIGLMSLRRTLGILAIPIAQLLLLRIFFRSVLDVSVGWLWFTDFDLVVPGVIAFAVLRLALDLKKVEPLSFQSTAGNLNTILTAVLILLTAAKSALTAWVGFWPWYSLWFLVAVPMGLASMSLFVDPRTYFRRENLWLLLPCGALATSMILINNFDSWIKPTWHYVGPLIAASTFHFLQLFWGDSVNAYFSFKHLMIHHDSSSILIGARCGGFDALSFFLILFSMFYMVRRQSFSVGSWIAFVGLGLVMMYFANVVRIASIFSVAIWLGEFGIRPATRTWFVYSFHGHVGWVLYLTLAGAYFHSLNALAVRREAEANSLKTAEV